MARAKGLGVGRYSSREPDGDATATSGEGSAATAAWEGAMPFSSLKAGSVATWKQPKEVVPEPEPEPQNHLRSVIEIMGFVTAMSSNTLVLPTQTSIRLLAIDSAAPSGRSPTIGWTS